jgi:threonine dehydratase
VYEAAVRTPLVRLDLPRAATDPSTPEIFLKLETLQPIGSFKIRGAYNAVRRLTRRELDEGVWTVSAGNAAQGVALAARRVGARCSVQVIETAPETKLRAIERLGATIVKAPYEECWKTVEQHASDRMHGHFVHPFDDDDFISGNGTIGLEIVEDLPDVDAVIAPLGGGGLLSGVAAALRELRPEATVYAAEPQTAAPLAASSWTARADDRCSRPCGRSCGTSWPSRSWSASRMSGGRCGSWQTGCMSWRKEPPAVRLRRHFPLFPAPADTEK